ncbi:cytochrome c3 family protein [Shewanella carassii]|uniref:cytochrome c3 family protein n=1 Tax=Shewanella carassii TaxID=1987584 RepID=UPI000C1E275B|nr:cytochrome c3 family protein [Shewanella carassii]BCV67047.1 cytochrome c [Shewanella carassii]
MLKIISTVLVTCALMLPGAANAMKIKDYHKEVMTAENGRVDCAACHGDAKRKTIPDATACEACHGTPEDVAKQTARPANAGHDVEPNPHDSLHYGTDLPCTYCHQEHKESKVYCNQCHEFTYPAMKR